MKNKLFILIGGSGTGKTTTERMLNEKGFPSVISHTTRAPRENEVDGVDYHFVDKRTILDAEKANHIVITNDWHYAVLPSSLNHPKMVYSVINIAPALQLKKYAEKQGYKVILIYFNISKEIRTEKMIARGEKPESIKIRLGREDSMDNFLRNGIFPDYVEDLMDADMQNRIIEFVESV